MQTKHLVINVLDNNKIICWWRKACVAGGIVRVCAVKFMCACIYVGGRGEAARRLGRSRLRLRRSLSQLRRHFPLARISKNRQVRRLGGEHKVITALDLSGHGPSSSLPDPTRPREEVDGREDYVRHSSNSGCTFAAVCDYFEMTSMFLFGSVVSCYTKAMRGDQYTKGRKGVVWLVCCVRLFFPNDSMQFLSAAISVSFKCNLSLRFEMQLTNKVTE